MEPRLRFKQFNVDWKVKTFSDISLRIGDGIHATPRYDLNGEFFFINGNNLVDGEIKVTESTKRVSREESARHASELTDQTILLSINGTIGNLAFYQSENIVLGKSACYINLKKDISKNFVYQLLQSAEIKSFFRKQLTGSTIKNLSLGTIKSAKFLCPDADEMDRIGDFLSAVDVKAAQLRAKLSLMTRFKKGLLQQIFGEKIRFKAGNGADFPVWQFKKFGDIYEFKSTNSYSRDCLNYEAGEVKNIHYGDIHTKFKSNFNVDNENVPFINTEIDILKIPSECYCREGDLVIADASEDYDDIGKTI